MLKTLRILTGIAGCALFMPGAGAQAPQPAPSPAPAAPTKASTNDSQAAAVELLRRVIKEQQQNPDKIIRSNPDGAEGRPAKPASAASGPRLSRAELERQFLEGKITAKQFQRASEELEKNPLPPPVATTKKPSKETAANPNASRPAVAPGPSGKAPPAPAEPEPEQKALADVEAKIDEMLARREAQLQAARTNASSTNSPAKPLTKREKMNDLLRLLIQGKITEQEYNAQREKVLALPEP